MATPDLLKQIQELAEDPKNVSSAQIQALMQASLEFFDQMKGQVTSKDPKEQETAKRVLADLKAALEEQSQALCKSLGIDPSQIREEPGQLDPEDAEAILGAQREYDLRKQQLQAPQRSVKRSQRLIFS